MIRLYQTSPQWATLPLAPSKLTCGRFGCTTCCICMLSDYFNCYRNPAQAIGRNIFYTDNHHPQGPGLVLWDKIDFPFFRFEKRVFGFNQKEIDESLKNPDKAVALQVNYGSHWVVATSKILGTKHYFIADPMGGLNPTTMKYPNITGSAHFIRK